MSKTKTQISKHPFSAVLITLNAADTIGQCLAALVQVTDDIVVLDSFSEDGTVEICESYGARVIPQKWLGYAETKNVGNEKAKHDWILSVDSDEVLSDELIASLKNWSPKEKSVFLLDRINNYEGKWVRHSGWYPDWKPRLFNRGEIKWQGDYVHETLKIPDDFHSIKLNGRFYHYSYKDEDDHLRRIEKYARLSAEERFAAGKKANFVKLWLSPPARFFATFILNRGFLDGQIGWKIAKKDMYLVRLKYRLLRDMWRKRN